MDKKKQDEAQRLLLLVRKLKSKNWIERWQAAYRLGEMKNSAAVDPLIELLEDPDRDVRKVTIEALGKIGDAKAITHIARFLKDQDKDLRLSAVRAFGQMKDPRVAGYLIELLTQTGDQDVEMKKFLIHHLGELEALEAIDIIVDMLDNEMLESYGVRALMKIGERGYPSMMEKLDAQDARQRRLACLALGKIRCFEAVDRLKDALNDSSFEVQQEALRALSKIGDKKAIGILASLLDQNSPLTDEAALHLKRLGHPKATEYFRKKADAKVLEVPD